MDTLITTSTHTGQHRFAPMATMVITRTPARLMGTTARVTLSAAYLLAPGPGITATTATAIMDVGTMAEDITADQDITDTDTTDAATADAGTMVVRTAGAIVAVITAAAFTVAAFTVAAGMVAGNLI